MVPPVPPEKLLQWVALQGVRTGDLYIRGVFLITVRQDSSLWKSLRNVYFLDFLVPPK